MGPLDADMQLDPHPLLSSRDAPSTLHDLRTSARGEHTLGLGPAAEVPHGENPTLATFRGRAYGPADMERLYDDLGMPHGSALTASLCLQQPSWRRLGTFLQAPRSSAATSDSLAASARRPCRRTAFTERASRRRARGGSRRRRWAAGGWGSGSPATATPSLITAASLCAGIGRVVVGLSEAGRSCRACLTGT